MFKNILLVLNQASVPVLIVHDGDEALPADAAQKPDPGSR